MVRTLLPHLVLLDDGLPGMDGLECLDLLRASKGMQQTPVILMSAAPPQSVQARTDLILLEKPFEMESLLTLIRHLLAFELMRFFLFPPLIYKISMEEARWGAVYPETHRRVLKIEGNCSRLRAKSAHFVDLTHFW